MNISIIGLGEIGFGLFKEFKKYNIDNHSIFGTEINSELCKKLKDKGYWNCVSTEIVKSDIYIICVYTTEQVFDVIKNIDMSNNPLIIIESTIEPRTHEIILDQYRHINLVIFPHRFNPNDTEHQYFNLKRVYGTNNETSNQLFLNFYSKYISLNNLYKTTLQIAELSKPLENAYRYIEIAIAEELKMLCDKYNIDFKELRKTINTKWNIDLKEARKGIEQKCLPKDMKIITNYFKKFSIAKTAFFVNSDYVNKLNNE